MEVWGHICYRQHILLFLWAMYLTAARHAEMGKIKLSPKLCLYQEKHCFLNATDKQIIPFRKQCAYSVGNVNQGWTCCMQLGKY